MIYSFTASLTLGTTLTVFIGWLNVSQEGKQATWDSARREGRIDDVDLVHELSQISICIACQRCMIPGVIHEKRAPWISEKTIE